MNDPSLIIDSVKLILLALEGFANIYVLRWSHTLLY